MIGATNKIITLIKKDKPKSFLNVTCQTSFNEPIILKINKIEIKASAEILNQDKV